MSRCACLALSVGFFLRQVTTHGVYGDAEQSVKDKGCITSAQTPSLFGKGNESGASLGRMHIFLPLYG